MNLTAILLMAGGDSGDASRENKRENEEHDFGRRLHG